MSKTALILGVGGQDGSYLAELLLGKGYAVHGLHRRSSVDNLWRIRSIRDRVKLHQGDVTDPISLGAAFSKSNPDEVYNMADQDDQRWSWSAPGYSWAVTSGAVVNVLEMVRVDENIRLFQPCSCLMFGSAPPPQDESCTFAPQSPYACAKAAAYHLCRCYRVEHGVRVSIGIMFNHDSPARSDAYVVHKVCKAAVEIAAGRQSVLGLGNVNQRFDVSFAGDCVEAAWLMLQQDPDDFCIGSGIGYTVEEIVREAFLAAGISDKLKTSPAIRIEPQFYRPITSELIANPSKANSKLGWRPRVSMPALVKMIVEHYRGKP